MSELVIFSGKLKGRRLILPEQRDVVVGRDEDCQMRIASSLVSRKHCILKASPEGIVVRDLESQNGTYVNDVAITGQFVMKAGDVLRVGAALFQVPKPKPVIRKPEDAPNEGLSDDEISSWISDQDPTLAPSNPDTTVIKGRKPPSSASLPTSTAAANAPSPQKQQAAVPQMRQPAPPKSIKEQAAEIIQRHWEMTRKKE